MSKHVDVLLRVAAYLENYNKHEEAERTALTTACFHDDDKNNVLGRAVWLVSAATAGATGLCHQANDITTRDARSYDLGYLGRLLVGIGACLSEAGKLYIRGSQEVAKREVESGVEG